MEKNNENLIEQAIKDLQDNLSWQEILRNNKEAEEELATLKPVLITLASLPKNQVPNPKLRFKFASAPKMEFQEIFAAFSRALILPVSFVAGALLIITTSQAASQSLPGQHLFSVKRSFEKTALKLTPESKQAEAQINLTEKRLQEASSVLANNPDPKSAQAAIVELSQQTETLAATVKKVSLSQNISPEQVSLLTTAAEITKKQDTLFKNLKTDEPETNKLSEAAAAKSEEVSKDIFRIIATVNEKAIATLTASNEVIISGGVIQLIGKNSLTVEKTLFSITDQTNFVDKDGKILTFDKSLLKAKVTISGTKQESAIIAKQVVVLEIVEQGEIKGETTTTKPAPSPEPEETVEVVPITATFIPETP